MVTLSKIYTKTGDDGTTQLGDGQRIPKDAARIEAYGTVDELNGLVGMILATAGELSERQLLEQVSNDLFDVGADLCVPRAAVDEQVQVLRVTDAQVRRLENAIDRLNADLPILRSFLLPGGSSAAGWCHLARTVCRRAERRTVTLNRTEAVNPVVLKYLNRLSDLLFVLARVVNQNDQAEILWEPGKGRVD